PINPQRYAEILRAVVARAGAETTVPGKELLALADHYHLPSDPSYTQAPDFKRALATIDGAAALIERGLEVYRGDAGIPALHRLLVRQAYHLAFWRVAFSAINYRRFFDINDLAGLRAEHPATFRAMHPLVARLIGEDRLQGIRLDHIDGLRDPAQYVRRLRELIRRVRPDLPRRGFYILVEKILGEDERMPNFGVDGTTGYERLNLISRVLVNGDGLAELEGTWRHFTGELASFQNILRAAKLRVLDSMLASEFTVLTRALGRIAAGHSSSRDYTPDRLRAALQAYVLEFPVYRTYVTAARIPDSDRRTIDAAIGRAREAWSGPDPDIFNFLRDAITTDLASDRGYSARRVRDFALKLQQFTGPLMAKSLEDTTFYRHHSLLALNEVGGSPDAAPLTVPEFHAAQARAAQDSPHGLIATATHDTKRGEDARMRILVLSELPDEWRSAAERWRDLNARHIPSSTPRWPSANHEYMLYQSLIGAWPVTGDSGGFTERFQAYALKAAREGKRETSWTNPNENYEAALSAFVAAILDPARSAEFIKEVGDFARRIALLGALNSLSQLTLKVLSPGVPDFFQGTELWDLSLVDPDNRRPVDFNRRQALLGEAMSWPTLTHSWPDGRVKIVLMRQLLSIRNEHAALLREGRYDPVGVEGADRDHVIAFRRSLRGQNMIVAAGRHFAPLTDNSRSWPRRFDARLATPRGAFIDVLRGGGRIDHAHDIGSLFAELPLAVLLSA
ncbi:MAG: malto-oligosyltrehalose synthase, partial [Pseudolabrys sp.]|nr:malto-oligosyltrehalose synthase [Pseudolabrys sp.]